MPELELMDFPVEKSYAVLIYDFHLEDSRNVKFVDKNTKIWVKKFEKITLKKITFFGKKTLK